MKEEKITKLIEGLPRSPGVYLMKSSRGKVVYVGKAKSLRARVRSYFAAGQSDVRFFAQHVRQLVDDIEVILTATEKEALLLENNLIKRHNPRFNIRLRDDKDFLSLRLDPAHPWPRLELVRRPQRKDKALYFGPYHNASAARQMRKLVSRHFKLRTCKDREMANRTRPCLQYQIHRCLAPCTMPVDPEDYRQQVDYVRLFLLGRREELLKELRTRMQEAADELEFEKAASLRDTISAIEAVLAPQGIKNHKQVDQDVIGYYRQGSEIQIAVLEVRGGGLIARLPFFFSGQEFPDEEVLSSFIVQHYTRSGYIPAQVLVPRALPDATALTEFLSESKEAKVQVIYPQRGSRVDQVAMANLNAKQLLEEQLSEEAEQTRRLERIAQRLRLPKLPQRIECVDISHLGGENTVGAISVALDGRLSKRHGRTFHVRGAGQGDDYAAITEVLSRRFARAKSDDEEWQAPDLLVIDGGRGQLNTARAVLVQMGLGAQPVVALAKERAANENAESDRVYILGRKNHIPLKSGVSALQILAMVRDEAHRLAVSFQRKTRRKKSLGSKLDAIEGVGPKLKKELLKQLGSVKRIGEASDEELLAVPGVGPNLLQKIRATLS